MCSPRPLLGFLLGLFLAFGVALLLPAQQNRWEALTKEVGQLYQQGRYEEALPIAQEALRVAEATFGLQHSNVGVSLVLLASVYREQGRLTEAEPLFQRAGAIQERALGPDHPATAAILLHLAVLYREQGRYAEAEPLFQLALGVFEQGFGPDHSHVATILNGLALLYYAQGRFIDAESLFQRALTIWEKVLGSDHPKVADSLNNLSFLYRDQGRYAEAEPLFQRALAIREKAFGRDHPKVAASLGGLASLYIGQGRYGEAELLYQRALAIREKVLGTDHPDVATSLNNLAGLYINEKRFAEAEIHFQRALTINEKILGPDHPAVTPILGGLGSLYIYQGRYTEAESFFQRALAIQEKAFGHDHPKVATSLGSLAFLYRDQGRYAEAEPLFQRALAIRERVLGTDHPDVATSLNNFAVLHRAQARYSEAEPLFIRALGNLRQQFEQHFTYMSEKERLQFLDTVDGNFQLFFSFVLAYHEQAPELVGKLYDVMLWKKGFIAQSIAALRSQVAASENPNALRLFEELTTKKTQLAKLLQTTPDDPARWRQTVEGLEKETNELERELVKHSTGLAEQKQLARVTWRDVHKVLKKGEAAVDFLRFRYHDGTQWTDKTYYVALVITTETTSAPALVFLGEADKLEGVPLAAFREWLNPEGAVTPGSEQRLYSALWKPLEAALGDANRVYLSPDGALNLIAWNALPAGTEGELLIDRYDLRILSTTKHLLRPRRKAATDTAVLVGNPSFNLDENELYVAAQTIAKNKQQVAMLVRGRRSRDQLGETLSPLPGTQAELKAVQALLQEHRWEAEAYSEDQALEEVVKRAQAPRILHVATHGFFLPDQVVEQRDSGLAFGSEIPSHREDPMLRSGLFLAGAERTLAGQPPADMDDGILTAYEATGLNLHGTELVVLSACETGLGEVKNGEGVFGLRRALEVAGAQNILMSLWAVPDRETQELMTLFYRNWLAGQSKPDALRAGQQELRARVRERYGADLPYFWGAFVLVGR